MLNLDYYAKSFALDEEYNKVLLNLQTNLNKASNVTEKMEIINNFANEYTVIPDIWTCMIFLFIQNKQNICHILKASLSHFYSWPAFKMARESRDEFWNPLKTIVPFRKCFYYIENRVDFEKLLTFPQASLEYDYKNYVEFSDHPINEDTLKRYGKAKAIAKLLTENDRNNNYESWIEICFEWEDKKFAYQTIECKLCMKFTDKILWKAYIQATKSRNKKARLIMLNIHYRYTRLFLEDKEMQRIYEYEKENAMKEETFENLLDLEFYLFDEYKVNLKNAIMNVCNAFKKVNQQIFALPKTIITYILDSSTARLRFKLFTSCKLFYIQKQTPICHKLQIGANTDNHGYSYQSLLLRETFVDFKVLSKLYISNRLEFKYPNLKMLSLIIPKLYKCEARFVQIWQQVITTKEFEFLASYKLEKFAFINGGITNAAGNVESLENILQPLSNAYEIRIRFNQMFELSPCLSLSHLKRRVKIKICDLEFFNSMFDLNDYCNFILQNAASDASFILAYGSNVSLNIAAAFDHAVNEFTMTHFKKKIHRKSLVGYSKWYCTDFLTIFNHPKIVKEM